MVKSMLVSAFSVFVLGCIYFLNTGLPSSILLAVICTSFVLPYLCFGRENKDPFEPIKLSALLYSVSFFYAPLFLLMNVEQSNYAFESFAQADYGIGLLLLGFFFMLFGYFVPIGERGDRADELVVPGSLKWSAVFMMLIGLASYLVLVLRSGGLGHFLNFSGGRNELFLGVSGGFYWGIFFLLSGLSLYLVSEIKNHLSRCFLLTLMVGACYFLLQGRSLALAPFFAFILIYHYSKKQLSLTGLTLAASSAVLLATVLGAKRHMSNISLFEEPLVFLATFSDSFGQFFLHSVRTSIEQLDIFNVALEYINEGGRLLYGASLTNFLEPVDRLFGNRILDSVHIGRELAIISDPRLKELNTAASPSLPGELFMNFGALGLIMGVFIYGLLQRALYLPIGRGAASPLYLAFYTYALWIVSKMVVDGSVLLFKLIVFAVPLILLSLFKSRTPKQITPDIEYRQQDVALNVPLFNFK